MFVKSGKGGRHRYVPLTSQPWPRSASSIGWWMGKFYQSSARKTWRSACEKAGVNPDAHRP